jgi:hypothetical protein
VPGGTKVARHVTGHRKVVPRGGTKRGNNTAEGRGNKAAEDGNEGRNRRAWQQGCGRRGRQGESEERAAGGRSGRSGSREVHSSARGTQLAARGPSGNRRPSAKIYTRRYTENRTGAIAPHGRRCPNGWRMKANRLLRPKTGEMPEREPPPRGGENNRRNKRRTWAVSPWENHIPG